MSEDMATGWLADESHSWRIGFVGAGRVGSALAILLRQAGYRISAISSEYRRSAEALAQVLGDSGLVAADAVAVAERSDLIFITTPDDAIAPVAGQIGRAGVSAGKAVVHTSGALPSLVLAGVREHGALIASLHPLQAFASVEAALSKLRGSSFAIEGDPLLLPALTRLVSDLGGVPMAIRPQDKVLYHAAAVIAANYAVTLADVATSLLAQTGIPKAQALQALLPLLQGSLDNLKELGLPHALTGPVARGDVGTVRRHLTALDATDREVAALYRSLAAFTLPVALGKGLDADKLNALHDLLTEPAASDADLYDDSTIAEAM